jgi:hypothetical protein
MQTRPSFEANPATDLVSVLSAFDVVRTATHLLSILCSSFCKKPLVGEYGHLLTKQGII